MGFDCSGRQHRLEMDLHDDPELADLMQELARDEADPAGVELDSVYSTSEQGSEQTTQQTKVVLKLRRALEVRRPLFAYQMVHQV